MGDAPGSDAWLKQVFDLAVRDALFPQAAVGSPLLVLLGGQPAAGKTRAQEAILTTHPELVSITGDDLRQYHPDYYDLCVSEPIGMPAATAPVSGGLVKFALDHALEHRYPVLLEGTFRDPEMVCGTATRFAAAGYRVEMVAVATPAPVSRLGTEQRYLGAGHPALARWTPPEAHEVALVGSSRVVAALEASPAVSQTQVHSRERLLYENTRTESGKWAEEPRARRCCATNKNVSLRWIRRPRGCLTTAGCSSLHKTAAATSGQRLLPPINGYSRMLRRCSIISRRLGP